MGDRSVPTRPPHQTARTGPAQSGDWAGPTPTSFAGLVLLYSPSFRSMPAAYPFDKGELVIGRSASSAIALDDQAVSREHARITCRDSEWHIEDLGSRNGILLDGLRATEAVLEPLLEVRVGDALFKFVDREAEEHVRYRIDGALDGQMATLAGALVGGFPIRRIERDIAQVAPTTLSWVVLGETGTGKEVVAREAHRLSGRPGEFRAINCGAIPQNLLESELFGFRRGAFSGADRDKPGLVQQAHRGTLFLDEIGDMPMEAQVKLLRVLATREVFPLGATQPVPVDVRVISATHRDLYRSVQEGTFRGDLFARLNEHTTVVPPLREHKESIYALTQAFLARHATRRLEPSFAFMMALLQYDWPFNVRELESAIKRAAALADAGILEPKHLPLAVLDAYASSDMAMNRARGSSILPPGNPSAKSGGAPARPSSVPDEAGFLRGAPTESKLRDLLARHDGNVAAVGRELGKGRMQVHRWMKRYGVMLDEYRRR